MKACIVELSQAELRRALGLPDGADVVDCHCMFGKEDTFVFKVRGVGEEIVNRDQILKVHSPLEYEVGTGTKLAWSGIPE